MFSLVEAEGFRCLRHVRQALGPFHVLVGPNASGKTTFLDVVSFASDLVTHGLDVAIRARTQNFEDLVWGRKVDGFRLSLEAKIPEQLKPIDSIYDKILYRVSVVRDLARNELAIDEEEVVLVSHDETAAKPIVLKKQMQSVFRPERDNSAPLLFNLAPRQSALGSLPSDIHQFPAATWLKALLFVGVDTIVLDSQGMRRASAPGQGRTFLRDGANLPWVVESMQMLAPEQFGNWIAHLQTALPDLEGMRVVERADDRHRYLMLRYRGGLEVPSWMTSDGTLRLLALTLLAYMPERDSIHLRDSVYLIEEPENGIHPRAIETMYQSLSNVYGAQVLLATHSPIVLSMVEPSDLLCFSKDDEGATHIVTGDAHPALKEWRHETNLSTLFAAGVLG
jgi:predicted ATPase